MECGSTGPTKAGMQADNTPPGVWTPGNGVSPEVNKFWEKVDSVVDAKFAGAQIKGELSAKELNTVLNSH